MRFSPTVLVSSVLATVALACGPGSGTSASRFDVAAEFTRVTAARTELSSARDRLARATASAPGAGPAGERELSDARAAFDAAYDNGQRVLARFLTVALNQAPERPETRAALDLYAADAVANARYVLDHDGNRDAALADLQGAGRAYAALGLAAPAQLAAAIDLLASAPRPTPSASTLPVAGRGRGAGRSGRAGSRTSRSRR